MIPVKAGRLIRRNLYVVGEGVSRLDHGVDHVVLAARGRHIHAVEVQVCRFHAVMIPLPGQSLAPPLEETAGCAMAIFIPGIEGIFMPLASWPAKSRPADRSGI